MLDSSSTFSGVWVRLFMACCDIWKFTWCRTTLSGQRQLCKPYCKI